MDDLINIRTIALRHAGSTSDLIPRLQVFTLAHPTEITAMVYEPVVCLVLQGAKRTFIGDKVFQYRQGECMIVAAEVAALGQISQASPECPYLALNLYLDSGVLSSLLADMAKMPEPAASSGFSLSKASPILLDTWRRLVELLDRPDEIPVMGALLERELMFRLLTSAHGEMLRQIAGSDTRLHRIRRAMAWIREHYADHLSINDMAAIAGMSVSVFHRRFNEVTALSPLQYQKHIRLHEARRRIVADEAQAATVGFAVGYASASQFSREYKRLFGKPPGQDVEMLRTVLAGYRNSPIQA